MAKVKNVIWMLIALTPALGQVVDLSPAGTVVASPGETVHFTCYATYRFDSIRWIINGTYLDYLELQKLNPEDIHSELSGEGLKILRFNNLPLKYNSTTLSCVGQGHYGRVAVSDQATLLVVEGERRPTATELGILVAIVVIVATGVITCLFKSGNSNRIDFGGLNVDINAANFIGRGAFGSVYKGTYEGSPVAVKLLNYHIEELIAGQALKKIAEDSAVIPEGNSGETTQKNMQKFQDECDRLSELNHTNIVCHIATLFDKSGFPILVMELMKFSLKQYLEAGDGNELSLDYQFSLCIDICKGLAYLRQKGLVHRDLCADNVLLALPEPDSPPKAKIADVGLSKLLCGDFSITLSVVTKREAYLAPEAISEPEAQNPGRYEYSLDMYAFGVIAAQIIQMNSEMHTKMDLAKTLDKIPEQHPMNEVVRLCLSKDRKSRPEASKIIHRLNLAHQQIQ